MGTSTSKKKNPFYRLDRRIIYTITSLKVLFALGKTLKVVPKITRNGQEFLIKVKNKNSR